MRTVFLLSAAALLCALFSGCTVIGLVAGTAVDSRNEQPRHATAANIDEIPNGRAVQVTLTSGDTLHGTFGGLHTLPVDSNHCVYDSLQVLFDADDVINRSGESLDLGRMRTMVFSRELLSTREFLLRNGSQTQSIPLERIQEVYAPPKPTAYGMLGGLAGLAIDIALIIAASHLGPSM